MFYYYVYKYFYKFYKKRKPYSELFDSIYVFFNKYCKKIKRKIKKYNFAKPIDYFWAIIFGLETIYDYYLTSVYTSKNRIEFMKERRNYGIFQAMLCILLTR